MDTPVWLMLANSTADWENTFIPMLKSALLQKQVRKDVRILLIKESWHESNVHLLDSFFKHLVNSVKTAHASVTSLSHEIVELLENSKWPQSTLKAELDSYLTLARNSFISSMTSTQNNFCLYFGYDSEQQFKVSRTQFRGSFCAKIDWKYEVRPIQAIENFLVAQAYGNVSLFAKPSANSWENAVDAIFASHEESHNEHYLGNALKAEALRLASSDCCDVDLSTQLYTTAQHDIIVVTRCYIRLFIEFFLRHQGFKDISTFTSSEADERLISFLSQALTRLRKNPSLTDQVILRYLLVMALSEVTASSKSTPEESIASLLDLSKEALVHFKNNVLAFAPFSDYAAFLSRLLEWKSKLELIK